MRFFTIIAAGVLATPALCHADDAAVYRSVVRIEAATQVPDYKTPWNSGRFSGGTGTGFLIGKNQFMTNAHVVSNSQRLQLTVHGSPKKYPAKVVHIAHDCDLALLEVEGHLVFYHHLPAPRNQLMENIMYRGVDEIMDNWTASHDGTMVILPTDSDEIIITSVD